MLIVANGHTSCTYSALIVKNVVNGQEVVLAEKRIVRLNGEIFRHLGVGTFVGLLVMVLLLFLQTYRHLGMLVEELLIWTVRD